MKIASYSHDGTPTYGVVEGGGLIDMAPRLGARYPTLKTVLEAGALLEVEDAARGRSADHALDAVTLLPTIPDAGKILCIGLNYRSHVEEGGRDIPKQPMVFVRFPDSQVGSGEPLVRPKVSEMFDFEGEMAVVIGTRARHVREVDSLTYIAGYACFNDGSVRDWQRHTSQFTPGKNFHRSGSFGPWMVTADEAGDPAAHTLTTRLNGVEMQRATTDDLLFDVPRLIAYCSTFTELAPGDVIATGTTGGVGFWRDPQVFMRPGDVVEVEISGLGALTNGIVDE